MVLNKVNSIKIKINLKKMVMCVSFFFKTFCPKQNGRKEKPYFKWNVSPFNGMKSINRGGSLALK